MLNLDPSKLLVIAVVAVILLGPDKLPQVARQAGAAWRTFTDFRHRMETEVRSSIPDLPSSAEIARLARSPSALLNHLSTLSPDDPATGPATDPATGPATSGDPPRDESPGTGIGTDAPAAQPAPSTVTSTPSPTVTPAPIPIPPPADPALN